MNAISKIHEFAAELTLITDPGIRAFTEKCIEELPDYFFRVPASSTGKYHPRISLGEGGLLRHTQMAVQIAADLLH